MTNRKSLFPLGMIVATPAAATLLSEHGTDPAALLQRHQHGDWGLCDERDANVNAESLKYHARVMSVYEVGEQRIWLITEADRSSSTFLLPFEY